MRSATRRSGVAHLPSVHGVFETKPEDEDSIRPPVMPRVCIAASSSATQLRGERPRTPSPSRHPIALTLAVASFVGSVIGWVAFGLDAKRTRLHSPTAAQASLASQLDPIARLANAVDTSSEHDTAPNDVVPDLDDRESMRELTFAERHARLAHTESERLGVETLALHLGLDLVQASQSAAPCQTFADALTSIEVADLLTPLDWALAEAKAPAPSQPNDPTCEGLDHRLATLRLATLAAPTPTPKARRKRTNVARPNGSAEVAANEVAAGPLAQSTWGALPSASAAPYNAGDEPHAPRADGPSRRAPRVSFKLDEGLRSPTATIVNGQPNTRSPQ